MGIGLDILSALCLVTGSLFAIIGGIGVLRFPDFFSRLQIEGVKASIGTADKCLLTDNYGRGVDTRPRDKLPQSFASFWIECLYSFIATADHYALWSDGRGTAKRLPTVAVLVGPIDLGLLPIYRKENASLGSKVDMIAHHCRRDTGGAVQLDLGNQLALD